MTASIVPELVLLPLPQSCTKSAGRLGGGDFVLKSLLGFGERVAGETAILPEKRVQGTLAAVAGIVSQ